MKKSTKTKLGCGVLVGALFLSTCGVSTARGINGIKKTRDATGSMAAKIEKHKVEPDCLRNKKRTARALTSALGKENAEKVAEKIEVQIQEYEEVRKYATTDEELKEAYLNLSSAVYLALLENAIDNITPGQRIGYTYLHSTIIAPENGRMAGAQDAVFGPKVRECMAAIERECGR